jgi:hypothetical protein
LNSEVDGLEEKVRAALSPELQYACRHWGSHLKRVELGDAMVVEKLTEFSRGRILMWLEAMSLIGSISMATSLMEEARLWAVSAIIIYYLSWGQRLNGH